MPQTGEVREIGEGARPWSAAEDETLRSEYLSGHLLLRIAEAHGRWRASVASRLRWLGLVQE